jgi:hypothetical protein
MRTDALENRERADPPALATRTTVAVFGLLAAFAGVEHGLGEISQGPERAPGVVFESWPHLSAFEPLGGEPAMSLVPSLVTTGLLAVVVAVMLGVWSVRYAARPHGGTVLVGLSLLLLLVGGGFGPPLLGVLAGVLASRITAQPRPHPRAATRLMARLWPWPLVAAVGCFLALFPGTTLLSEVVGFDHPFLVAAVTIGAFVSTALAMCTARAHDLTSSAALPRVAGPSPPASSTSTPHGASSG